MKVIAFDIYPNNDLAWQYGFEYKDLNEILSNSDIITLHVPYLENTHHLINRSNIGQIKKGAVLINTSRGGVIETEALLNALQEGILFGAALDVLEEENLLKNGEPPKTEQQKKIHNQNLKLLEMKNVIITPHNAFNSQEALERLLKTTVENIIAFNKNSPVNLVKE